MTEFKAKPSARSFFGRIGAVLAAVAMGGPVGAQTASESVETREPPLMEEIFVTALKRTQALEDVPASVSAIDNQELELRGITNLTDLQFAVPSLHVGERLGSSGIQIRGLGTVAVSLDGVVLSGGQLGLNNGYFADVDIGRVEVLRGPQSTLYGRNTNGGVVNLSSMEPTSEPEGQLRIGYNDFDRYQIQGIYSGPITDKIRFRIAAQYDDQGEGWVENLVPGGEDLMQGTQTNIKATLGADLTDSLNLTLRYVHNNFDGIWDHFGYIYTDPTLPNITIPQILTYDFSITPFEQYAPGDTSTDRTLDVASLTASWELPFGMLKSITAWQRFENDFSMDRFSLAVNIVEIFTDDTSTAISQEFNLFGNTDRFEWLAGLYYLDLQVEYENPWTFSEPVLGFPLPPMLEFTVEKYDTRSVAAFVDGTWNISDSVRVSSGVRYTRDKVEVDHSNVFSVLTPAPVVAAVACDRTIEDDWNNVSFRVVGQYDVTSESNLYASYVQGYRSGGYDTDQCSPAFEPETVETYELGYKGSLFGGRMDLSTAVFYYKYTDFQVTQVVGIATSTLSAEAEGKGAEAEIRVHLSENWGANLGVTLLDTEYGGFTSIDVLQPDKGVQSVKGNSLNDAPEVSVNYGIEYSSSVPWGGTVSARVDAAYRSRTYFSEFNTSENSQSSYTVVNLNATWQSSDTDWLVRLYAKNVTDETYVTSTLVADLVGGLWGTYGPPRHVGFELTRRF